MSAEWPKCTKIDDFSAQGWKIHKIAYTCDYKIMVFVMVNRLQDSLDNIVSIDQTAHVTGMYIDVNARLVLHIFKCCEHFD